MTRLSSSARASTEKTVDPTRRRFYAITAAILLAIFLIAGVMLVYTEDSYVKIEITGTNHAYFVLAYDSTNVTIPSSQNATVEVLPNANVTITAYPNATYTLLSWYTSGADVLRTGNNSISFLTGKGGSIIQVSAVLSTTPVTLPRVADPAPEALPTPISALSRPQPFLR